MDWGGLVAGAAIAVVVGLVGGYLGALVGERRAARSAARVVLIDVMQALARPGKADRLSASAAAGELVLASCAGGQSRPGLVAAGPMRRMDLWRPSRAYLA